MTDAQTTADGFGRRLAPPGDPWEGAAFDALYDGRIAPELARCEVERRRDVAIFIAAATAGALVIALEIFAWSAQPVIVGFTAIAALGLGYAPLGSLAKKAKSTALAALCAPLGIEYEPRLREAPYLDGLVGLKLIQRPEGAVYTDAFRGRRGKADFWMCSAILTRGSGKERHMVFQGELFRLSAGRARLGVTVVLRNSGLLSGFEKPPGLRPVGLEDISFNKEFVVYGSDQVEAREILTPAFMQRLLDLEAGFAGAHIRCAFTGPDLLIALETSARFDIGGLFTSLVDKARVAALAARLEGFFKVVDGFGQV